MSHIEHELSIFIEKAKGNSKLHPQMCLGDNYCLDKGVDSIVYLDPEEWNIWKFYVFSRRLGVGKFELYKNLTNEVSAILEKEDWNINGIPVRANPMIGITYSLGNNCLVSLSRYIPGYRGSDVLLERMGQLIRSRVDNSLTDSDDYLGEKELQNYINSEKERQMLTDHGVGIRTALNKKLVELDDALGEKLKVDGIGIIPLNIKIDTQRHSIIITDVSAIIERVDIL